MGIVLSEEQYHRERFKLEDQISHLNYEFSLARDNYLYYRNRQDKSQELDKLTVKFYNQMIAIKKKIEEKTKEMSQLWNAYVRFLS